MATSPFQDPPLAATPEFARRVIALHDARSIPHAPQTALGIPSADSAGPGGPPLDRRSRPLHDLRISVTDRCNFRCSYCMPKDVFDSRYTYLPPSALLSFEEITRLARTFLALGVGKIRLTGGEPLLRRHIEVLVGQLADLRTLDGNVPDLTLTTNGSLLARKARALREAGLQRVTVSLDALDDTIFRSMNDVDFPVADVLHGIDAARACGLGERAGGGHGGIKVNMVVKRDANVSQILPMARHFRGSGVTLRFIEFMDVGATNGWRLDQVVPSADVVALLQTDSALVRLPATAPGETAQRWGYAGPDGTHDPALGEIGVVSSVTHAFCGDCNRARLSTAGQLYLCLFASHGHDLRALLRGGATDAAIAQAVGGIWRQRNDRYSELRSAAPGGPDAVGAKRVEMSHIGG